jgi:hypothetical protein
VVTVVITARLGNAPNGGEGDDRGELGFRLGRIFGAERKRRATRFVQSFIRCLGACLVTDSVEERTPARGEEKHGVSLAIVREEGDEDDLLLVILTKGYLGC